MRLSGVLLVFALLFSGGIVRIHGHADGAPSTSDCVACTASLTAAVEAGAPPAIDPPRPTGEFTFGPSAVTAPVLVFVRQGGLRDPPVLFA